MPVPAKSGPGKFAVVDPVDDAVEAERGRGERADEPERDADPLHRLRPEAGDHVQREPRRAAAASSASAPAAARARRRPPRPSRRSQSTSAFVNFCLPIEPSSGSIASRR